VKISWQACGSGKRSKAEFADGFDGARTTIGKPALAAATHGAPYWKTGLAAKFAQTRRESPDAKCVTDDDCPGMIRARRHDGGERIEQDCCLSEESE
jgi:hypothetical protein